MTGPRQLDALAAVRAYQRARGISPTRAEVGVALGITAVSAHLLLRKLAAAGLLRLATRRHRGISLPGAKETMV